MIKTKREGGKPSLWYCIKNNYFRNISSETVSLFLPLALLRANIFLPLAEDILSLKPCLLRLFLFDGWYVLFIL